MYSVWPALRPVSVPVTEAPRPPRAASDTDELEAPAAPTAVTWTVVTPAGTVKVCSAPMAANVTTWSRPGVAVGVGVGPAGTRLRGKLSGAAENWVPDAVGGGAVRRQLVVAVRKVRRRDRQGDPASRPAQTGAQWLGSIRRLGCEAERHRLWPLLEGPCGDGPCGARMSR